MLETHTLNVYLNYDFTAKQIKLKPSRVENCLIRVKQAPLRIFSPT